MVIVILIIIHIELICNANMNLAIVCLVSIPNQCTVWIDVISLS